MLKFAKERKKEKELSKDKWKILIVDDEPEVHTMTVAVLNKFEFKNKQLEFFNAYSGVEAVNIIKEHDDIALILLDVIMESDDAGLIAAKKD
jgi:CheY-like chemotaxis protein